jgi:ComF family protein
LPKRDILLRTNTLVWAKSRTIGRMTLNAILPVRCPITGKIVEQPGQIHPSAWSDVHFMAGPLCFCCGIEFSIDIHGDNICSSCIELKPEYDRARAVFIYDAGSKDMILKFKHVDQPFLLKSFIPWLCQYGALFRDHTDVIVPVPLHRFRLLKRRYNQAALLAQALALAWGTVYDPITLYRRKATPSQGHMTKAQRAENVSAAFDVRGIKPFTGKRVLLVDDVYTTGATVNACARVLRRAGAAEVNVLTLARVQSDFDAR